MEFVALGSNRDVEAVKAHLERGVTVRVELTFENGPFGPEPKVELLRLLLDDMRGTYRVRDLNYVPHPWIERRYLKGCVLRPVRSDPGGELGGVREPRPPRPDPHRHRAARSVDSPPEVHEPIRDFFGRVERIGPEPNKNEVWQPQHHPQ